jgi:hypothetical protein
MESINNRFNRLMDKYLLPAGYELQRVQHDYERLRAGKELFDQNIIGALEKAADNNERYDLLTSLKEQVLPNYDDLAAVYRDLIAPLRSAVEVARATPTKPVSSTFGELPGKTASDVARLVVEIFEWLCYIDVEQTFVSLAHIFRDELDESVRTKILNAVERLAKYDLTIWQKAGAAIQSLLVDVVARIEPEDQEPIRPLVIAVWQSALNSELTGTKWKADSVTVSFGSVPVTREVKAVRDKAMAGLFDLFVRSADDKQKRNVFLALREATRTPVQPQFSNELLRLTLTDGTKIANFLAGQVDELSYELKETVEHEYLFDYRRARDIAADDKDKFRSRDVASELIAAIIDLRDRINADASYVRYKTLVGFESVFAFQWDQENRDFEEEERFRARESERFLSGISPENEEEWFIFIERCAATKSDDLATFPVFGRFLSALAQRDSARAVRLLARKNSDLLAFLPALLTGLHESGASDTYLRCVETYVEAGEHLAPIAWHWRQTKPNIPSLIKAILDKAIEVRDNSAVIHCLLFAIENAPNERVPNDDEFFEPARVYLAAERDTRWVRQSWAASRALPFFDRLDTEGAKRFLSSLLFVPKVDHYSENMLSQIAKRHPALVWDYFGERLKRRSDAREKNESYEAIPYSFHGLEKQLGTDANLAVSKVRQWYAEDSSLFQFRGGRLLSIVFPNFDPAISQEFCELVIRGADADAEFVLDVMENYHGEPATHEVLKSIVTKYPQDRSKITSVKISFDATGVVRGEFGFVEAWREKKHAIEAWLSDSRPEVRDFAHAHIRDLEVRIAEEQRRAEQEKALRELQYDDDRDDTGDGNSK